MTKFTIHSRFDCSVVLFEREGDTLREVVIAAIQEGANLSGVDFSRANLSRADFSGANLSRADFSGANLSRADFSRANLSGANLSRADFYGVNLSGANLSRADFYGVKHDLWDVLLRAPREIDGLLLALKEGRVNGTCYQGECSCLVGTIANVAHVNYEEMEFLKPQASRPAERWFLAIRPGDVPDTSSVVKATVEWIEEFQQLLARAVALSADITNQGDGNESSNGY